MTTFNDSGLQANTQYQYHVVAHDGQENTSPRSNTAAATTGSGCTNPVCEVKQIVTDNGTSWA